MMLDESQIRRFDRDGFLFLRGHLEPDESARWREEIRSRLDRTREFPRGCGRPHWAPMMDEDTPFVASLIDDPRFAGVAEQLLRRPVLGEGTDGSEYVGDTAWHHDSRSPAPQAIKFTLYAEPLTASDGALRFVPGSQHVEYESARLCTQAPGDPGDVCVFDSRPGDVVVFDVRVWHAAFGGRERMAGSVNYRIDPRTPAEITDLRGYFEKSREHCAARYGRPLYPACWRSHPHPLRARWVARLGELGAFEDEERSR
jgi:hypothetical protein